MESSKNPWKKGSLRPIPRREKDEEKTAKERSQMGVGNANILGMEMTGKKITKLNEIGVKRLLSAQSKRSSNKQEETEEEEEEQKVMMSEAAWSDVSNMYDEEDGEEEKNDGRRLDFNNLMRERVEMNAKVKQVYDNHILNEKRREHEEEARKQTSKPFQKKDRMSQSVSVVSKQLSDGISSQQQNEKSTEYGSKQDVQSQGAIEDLIGRNEENFLGSQVDQPGIIGMASSRSGIPLPSRQLQNAQIKPFKISDLKRNSSKKEDIDVVEVKKGIHLSTKEKKRMEEEAALLQKLSKRQHNKVWKVNDPAGRQLDQLTREKKQKRKEQIEKIETQLQKIDKKLSRKSRLQVFAMVNGNQDMLEMMSMNKDKIMTEYDIELAEKEAIQYQIERESRVRNLRDFVEESFDDLSQMSARDIRNRALFITEFGKHRGSRIGDSQLGSSFVSAENPANGMIMNEEMQREEDEFQKRMEKLDLDERRTNGYFVEKNITNAFKSELEQVEEGYVSRLPPAARERLEQLMEGCEEFDAEKEEQKLLLDANPYEVSQAEQAEMDTLNEHLEEVKMDEEMIEKLLGHQLFSLSDAILPKDPTLREEAEMKILMEKMNEVNDRLRDLFEKENSKGKVSSKVERIKIQNLVASLVEQGVKVDESVEQQNIASEFEDNYRLLDESRRLITSMQGQNIEVQLGEFKALFLEAQIVQRQFEQLVDLPAQQVLMDEQLQIVDGFKSRFKAIAQIQEEIEDKQRNFMHFIKENNMGDMLGIQFNEENDDYEVEDINAITQQEQLILKEQIDEQLREIQQKYQSFEETQIDEKLLEMQELDNRITQQLLERNPSLFEELRSSVIQQQQKEDDEQVLARSFVPKPFILQYHQDHQTDEEQVLDESINNFSVDYPILEQTQITQEPPMASQYPYLNSTYLKYKQEIIENENKLKEIELKAQLIDANSKQDDDSLEIKNSSKAPQNQISFTSGINSTLPESQEFQFEDSLEM